MALPHKPALYKSNRNPWIAPVRMRSKVHFDEAQQRSLVALSHKNDQRQSRDWLSSQSRSQFLCIFLWHEVRPKLAPQLGKLL